MHLNVMSISEVIEKNEKRKMYVIICMYTYICKIFSLWEALYCIQRTTLNLTVSALHKVVI